MAENDFVRLIQEKLIDKLEKSSACPPKADMKPAEILPDYGKTTVSIRESMDFEAALKQLEDGGIICVKRQPGRDVVIRVSLVTERTDDVYRNIRRRKKSDIDSEMIRFLEDNANGSPVMERFCRSQIDKIQSGKKTVCDYEQMPAFVGVLRCVLENKNEIFERGFSISLFFRDELKSLLPDNVSKSKFFTNCYRSKIASAIAVNGDYELLLSAAETDTEKEHMILGEFGIVPNETVVYIKGSAMLWFNDGSCITTKANEITPVLSDKLMALTRANILQDKVMTVENLTSFKMLPVTGDVFYLYVAGYHKGGQNRLLRCIKENNNINAWYHFGDLDPWGFNILNNLREKTRIDFVPWKMGISEYLNKRYEPARIRMTVSDRRSAEVMTRKKIYADIMAVMLEHGYKLEQEAISFIDCLP